MVCHVHSNTPQIHWFKDFEGGSLGVGGLGCSSSQQIKKSKAEHLEKSKSQNQKAFEGDLNKMFV